MQTENTQYIGMFLVKESHIHHVNHNHHQQINNHLWHFNRIFYMVTITAQHNQNHLMNDWFVRSCI